MSNPVFLENKKNTVNLFSAKLAKKVVKAKQIVNFDKWSAHLTLCMLGNFACFFVVCGFFFPKISFFKKMFEEYHQSVKQFGYRSGLTIWVQTVRKGYQQTTPLEEKKLSAKLGSAGFRIYVCPSNDHKVMGSLPGRSNNIISRSLIMKYFLLSFSPFCYFKKGRCQFLVKKMRTSTG